jgi:hypothetical protein
MTTAPESFTPETLDAYRKAVSLKAAFWDATTDLERFIGREVNDDAFAVAAAEIDYPAQAMEISDAEATSLLVDMLGADITDTP